MTNPTLEIFKSFIGKRLAERSPSPISKWLDGTLVAVEHGSLTVGFVVQK